MRTRRPAAPRRRAARGPRPDRHEGGLQRRRLRRVHGAARRRAGLRLPRRRGPGRRPARRDGRGSRAEPTDRRALQAAFLACGGAQCGACTPGMLMAAGRPPRADREPDDGRGPRRPRRRALPVHRLHLDPRGGPRDRAGRRRRGPGPGGRRRGRRAHRPRRTGWPRSPAPSGSATTSPADGAWHLRAVRSPHAPRALPRRRPRADPAPAIPASSASSPPTTSRATTATGSTRPARTSRCSPRATSGTAARPCWRSSATRRPWPRSPTTSCRSSGSRCRRCSGIDAALDPAATRLHEASPGNVLVEGLVRLGDVGRRPGRGRRDGDRDVRDDLRRARLHRARGRDRARGRRARRGLRRPPRRRTWTATSWRWSSGCPRTACGSSRAPAAAGSAASSTCRSSR